MLAWFWNYVRPYAWLIVLGFVLTVIVSALGMVNPSLAGVLVDQVILGRHYELLWTVLGWLLGATVLRMILRFVFIMIFESISQSIHKKIREDLFARVQSLDFHFFDKTKTGDLMALLTGDLDTVRHMISWVGYQTFENSLIFLFSIIVLFGVQPLLTLILLVVTPGIALAAWFLAKTVRPQFGKIREQFSRLNSVVQENIAGNRIVKAFVREDEELRKFTKENDEYCKRNLDGAKIWGKYIPIIEFLSGLLMVIMILGGGLLIIDKQMTMGALVVFTGLVWALTQPLRMSGWLINDMQRFAASLDRLHDLALTKAGLTDAGEQGIKRPIQGEIAFRNVSFAYGDEALFTDLTFTVKPGMTVGIVGPTGSGKSSLVRMLARFHEATGGQILLDGDDIRTWDLQSLRTQVGYAMQDVFLFSDTLEGNIVFARPQATVEEALAASKQALAHDFIQHLQDGYDTIVGERGIGLSGGQRQRVALARLLLADPPIMVLDDTTSAVDLETEAHLQETMRSLHGRKTMFIVAHRLSTVKHADLILVLQDGRISQRGTHATLVKEPGWYQEVHCHQLGLEYGVQHGA